MRLRNQLFLSGLVTALFCGVLGSWVLARLASSRAESLLDGQLQTGEQALVRQWHLQRAQRHSTYDAVAKQTFLRAYLGVGDREQMNYFVSLAREKGADTVAIIDRRSETLAQDGACVDEMASRVNGRPDWPQGGALMAVTCGLLDVFRLPVGGDNPVGYIVVGNWVKQTTLREYTTGFGVQAALAFESACISTLPSEYPLTHRSLANIEQPDLTPLREHYRLRLTSISGAQLLVAVPLTKVRQFVASFLPQLAIVFVLVLLTVGIVILLIVDRVMNPLEQLQVAADTIGQGQFPAGRALMRPFLRRRDEIGALARTLDMAAKQLSQLVAACQSLTETLETAVKNVDRSAVKVAEGAERQKGRLVEMRDAVAPMVDRMAKTSTALSELSGAALSLSTAITSFEHTITQTLWITRSSGRPGVTVVSSVASEPVSSSRNAYQEQREAMVKIRDRFAVVKRRLDDLVEYQVAGEHQGQFISTATSEVGRVAGLHAEEANSLRTSAEQLRHNIERLQQLLSKIER